MIHPLVDAVEKGSMQRKLPDFNVGDTVDVKVRIEEGEKDRVQTFTGVVIGRGGRGTAETFTVRRMVGNEGVERTFPVHCPSIVDVTVSRLGKARRAKLYFLRDRIGKSAKVKEFLGDRKKRSERGESGS